MSVIDSLISWLKEFDGIGDAVRVTPDMLGEDDMMLSTLPQDEIQVYMDGSRSITSYYLFYLRTEGGTHQDRVTAEQFVDTLQQAVWRRTLSRDLPVFGTDDHREAASVKVSQNAYPVQTDGLDTIFAIGIAFNYTERRN